MFIGIAIGSVHCPEDHGKGYEGVVEYGLWGDYNVARCHKGGREGLMMLWPNDYAPLEEFAGVLRGMVGSGATLQPQARIELPETVDLVLLGSDFRRHIWRGLLEITSPGKVLSYSEFTEKLLGHKNSVRAVATAIGHNPIMGLVPCHRIVPHSSVEQIVGGEITAQNVGQYRWGTRRKLQILLTEHGELA